MNSERAWRFVGWTLTVGIMYVFIAWAHQEFFPQPKEPWISEYTKIERLLSDCSELRTVAAFVWIRGSDGEDYIHTSFIKRDVHPDQVGKIRSEVNKEAEIERDRIMAIQKKCQSEGKLP